MIDLNKKYKTQSGGCVVLYEILDDKVFGRVLLPTGWYPAYWYVITGRSNEGYYCENDLVEVKSYEYFKIDDPVMVRRSDDDKWKKRYFSGVDRHGSPTTWVDGKTSWTNGFESVIVWTYCRKPTTEELNGE